MTGIYLKIYNVFSGFLWLLVPLYFLGIVYFPDIEWIFYLALVQGIAVLDLVHIGLKWVKSPWLTTAVQYLSRMFVIAVLYFANFVWNLEGNDFVRVGTFLILLVWPLAEIIRFSYYASTPKDVWYKTIRFLRYSAFIILYPTGVLAEWLLMGKVAFFAFENRWMFWVILIAVVFILYILFFPKLYLYLWNQRKKLKL